MILDSGTRELRFDDGDDVMFELTHKDLFGRYEGGLYLLSRDEIDPAGSRRPIKRKDLQRR